MCKKLPIRLILEIKIFCLIMMSQLVLLSLKCKIVIQKRACEPLDRLVIGADPVKCMARRSLGVPTRTKKKGPAQSKVMYASCGSSVCLLRLGKIVSCESTVDTGKARFVLLEKKIICTPTSLSITAFPVIDVKNHP